MFLRWSDGTFVDYDMDLLEPMLELLDQWMLNLSENSSPVIDVSDELDSTAGIAFTLCQKYIKSTYGFLENVSKKCAVYETGPFVENVDYPEPVSIVSVMNAAANFWKHIDEWPPQIWSDNPTGFGIKSNKNRDQTIERLRLFLGEETQVGLCEVLYKLAPFDDGFKTVKLIPYLIEWRQNIAIKAGWGLIVKT